VPSSLKLEGCRQGFTIMPGSISFAEWVLLNLSCFALTMGCLGLEYLVIGCSNSRARLGW